jgi:hypothetical protein
MEADGDVVVVVVADVPVVVSSPQLLSTTAAETSASAVQSAGDERPSDDADMPPRCGRRSSRLEASVPTSA